LLVQVHALNSAIFFSSSFFSSNQTGQWLKWLFTILILSTIISFRIVVIMEWWNPLWHCISYYNVCASWDPLHLPKEMTMFITIVLLYKYLNCVTNSKKMACILFIYFKTIVMDITIFLRNEEDLNSMYGVFGVKLEKKVSVVLSSYIIYHVVGLFCLEFWLYSL
jgi:hypothetical protein